MAGENPGGTKEHTGVTSMSVHVKYMPVRVRGVEGPGGGQANRLILRVGSGTKRGELQRSPDCSIETNDIRPVLLDFRNPRFFCLYPQQNELSDANRGTGLNGRYSRWKKHRKCLNGSVGRWNKHSI